MPGGLQRKIGDDDYFTPLIALLEKHPDTPAAFMALLMAIEVDTRAVHKPIETEMKQALKLDHLPPAARFLQDTLERWPERTRTHCEDLFSQFRRWCDVNNEKEQSANLFGRTLSNYGVARVRGPKGVEGYRPWLYDLAAAGVPAVSRP